MSPSLRGRAPRSTRSIVWLIAAGGRDNGAPGLRPAPSVFDPDGNNVEAVCHRPG